MTAAQYAKALYDTDKPDFAALRRALERRKHGKLLPRILAEYQKLILARERVTAHKKITPQKERTRILLELYRKLAETR